MLQLNIDCHASKMRAIEKGSPSLIYTLACNEN